MMIDSTQASTVQINANNLSKHYGKTCALDHVQFNIHSGRVVGLIGPNGSGKTTMLKAILGLTSFDGELSVLGLNPSKQRDELMQNVSFIADVAILPKWLKVSEAIAFIEGVHPKFNREKAERYLAQTKIKNNMKVKDMSKGMVVQLHLALIMAIDANLLVLDEPTLGLDIMYRKMFYQHLIEDYFDENKTIIISTHQVEEVENILSDVIFLKEGKIILQASVEEIEERYTELAVNAENKEAAQALKPIEHQQIFGKNVMLFDGVEKEKLSQLGDIRVPSITDLFVATMKGTY